jgi:hypothetical protein
VAATRPPDEETIMRTRTIAVFALLLALGPAAACARGGGTDPQVASAKKADATPSASPSASASRDPDAPVKFSRCMREHGISWFPDPGADGRMALAIPQGTDKAKMDAAMEACKKFAPNGGQPPKMSAEDLEKARQMSKCMRENGVPDFPDPSTDGGLMIDSSKLGSGPGDPAFDKAEQACSKYMPKGARTGKQAGGGDERGATVSGT